MDSLSIPLDRAAEIIITSEVARRPDRTADLRREAEAFREISEAIVADPRVSIQRFLDTAIDLCHADAAGLSLPEDEGAIPQFRWDALAGVYADFVGQAVPRDHSPCGLARIRQETIVVSRPGRLFPEFAAVDPAIEEGLIVPFFDNGRRFLGTIWVVHTRSGKKFCANDLRVMEQLAVQMVLALKLLEEQSSTLEIQRMLTKSLDAQSFVDSDVPLAVHDRMARSPMEVLRNDVSHLVEASAFLSSVLGSSSDCIKVLNLSGFIEFVSEGGLQLLKAPNIDVMRGRLWQDAWTGTEKLKAHSAVNRAREGKTVRFQGTSPTFVGEDKFWDVQLSPIRHNGTGISHLLAVSRDVTEQKRIDQQREVLAKELDHRVKNILAMVVAIAHQTLREPATLDGAAKAFSARIAALGEAQSILTSSSWESADLRLVVEGALAAHRSQAHDSRFELNGPHVQLPANRALSLALAIHELAINATKYGALSQDGGKIMINWASAKDELHFEWCERGGPPVTEPKRRGFGSRLIESAMAAEFRGKVGIEYAPEGVNCKLTAPL